MVVVAALAVAALAVLLVAGLLGLASRRLTEAATQKSGRYDGWSAKQVPRESQL